jgi:RNA polymerase sigma-70 factor (ECF subfamily)
LLNVPSRNIGEIFRREHGRAVAVLARRLGDLSLAEEVVQDAFAAALEHWPRTGVPPAPAGWIITTARNRAIDCLRRESTREARHEAAMQLLESDMTEQDIADDQLRLIFTCCHPAIATESQVALTLRLLCGLETAQIARAFLVPEPTMAQRLSRAKAKIRAAGIPYRVPESEDLPARLTGVLAVVYLIFNEGYSASTGDELLRPELIAEALRLGRLLRELVPGDGEVAGLLALMLLVDARRAARVDRDGRAVRLADQDRAQWNRGLIAEGQELLRECLARNLPGPYQLQAAINAVHSDAREATRTDWQQILALYDQLMAMNPTPVVALNRSVALAEVQGPDQALRLIDELELPSYPWFHAVRADLLLRLQRREEAAESLAKAICHCTNAREREWLERRRAALGA